MVCHDPECFANKNPRNTCMCLSEPANDKYGRCKFKKMHANVTNGRVYEGKQRKKDELY